MDVKDMIKPLGQVKKVMRILFKFPALKIPFVVCSI